jgi:hypothetical protein
VKSGNNRKLEEPGNWTHFRTMNLKHFRERISNGFRPFRIVTSSGRRYDVPHPELIMIGKSVVVVMEKNDIVHTIDGLHITAIEEGSTSKRRK